jgi:hypothetical protein
MGHKPAVKRSREPLAAPCPPQAASTLRNSPTVRFGTSTRDQDAKVFISQEHEKGAYGTCRCAGSGTTAPSAGRGERLHNNGGGGALAHLLHAWLRTKSSAAHACCCPVVARHRSPPCLPSLRPPQPWPRHRRPVQQHGAPGAVHQVQWRGAGLWQLKAPD